MRYSNFEDKPGSELWLAMFAKLVAKGAVRISSSGSNNDKILQSVVHNNTSGYVDKYELCRITSKSQEQPQ
jgi:hypothetical protein